MWHFGISGSLWAWFKNYLSNRYQRVSINNNLSHTLPVVSGVPQGSILGPVLFLIYMNDITSSTRHSQLLIYADDTKCFKHLSSVTDQTYLQEDINAIITWSKSSQLNFNISKCTHISFKPKFVSSYNLSDTAISITDFQKDLGLVVSNDLSWENYYNHIIPHAYKNPRAHTSFVQSISKPISENEKISYISSFTVDVLYSNLSSILTQGYSEHRENSASCHQIYLK